jgi:hypothetical protein
MKLAQSARDLYFSTVLIEYVSEDGTSGTGTGFFFLYESADDRELFVVTNRHVIDLGVSGSIALLRAKDEDSPSFGTTLRISVDNWSNEWAGHPNPEVDIAVMPFDRLEKKIQEGGQQAFFRFISSKIIPTDHQLRLVDAITQVTFLGYPAGLSDRFNGLPVARRAFLASLPEVDFEGELRFLVDARIWPGHSGSPVFLIEQRDKDTEHPLFLGVLHALVSRPTFQIKEEPIRAITDPFEQTDVASAAKARTIPETIEALRTNIASMK